MNTFIEKDSAIKAMIKEENLLLKKRNALQKKIVKRVEKLISTRIPTAISAHNWVISDDPYSDFSSDKSKYSLSFRIYDEEKDDVCSGIKLPGIPLSSISLKKKALGVSNGKASKYKKNMISYLPKINPEIKNWRDISRICEHWDIHLIKLNKNFISIGDRSFRIISNDGLDSVFLAAKDLGITLNMRSSLSEIEGLESYLEKKKKLMSDLSSKMLFSV